MRRVVRILCNLSIKFGLCYFSRYCSIFVLMMYSCAMLDLCGLEQDGRSFRAMKR